MSASSAAKLPMVEYVPVQEHEWRNERERVIRAVTNALRLPYFVKPANAGSSVGVTKVKNDADLGKAMDHAFRFDEKVLVERGIDAREIEISILGNEAPQASVPGEIVVGREFYDYVDKYVENKSSLVIPAKLAADKAAEIQRLALAAFKAVGASIPGFTAISMYPKLWEATELKYARLIERIIQLGIDRAKVRKARVESTMRWFDEVAPLT